jgi:tape measure domain-containing protein
MAKRNTVEIILNARDQASKTTEQAFSTIRSSASKTLDVLKTASLAAGAAVTALAGIASKVGIEFNASMEQSQIAWETLLGNADEAKKTMQELLTLGAETPFEFQGLDKAAKLLNMAKFEGDELTKALVNVGDAVSAVGGGQGELEGVSMALFQMQAKGKASAEEMNQLAERGIPAWEILSESMGKSTQELMDMSQKGKLFAEEVIPALVDGMGDRFGGAMEKQSKTFKGLTSTLSDNLRIFAGEVMEPTFNRLKELLPTVIDEVNRLSDAFTNAGWKGVMEELLPPDVVEKITLGIQTVKDAFGQLEEKIGPILDSFTNLKEKITNQDWSGIGEGLGKGLANMLKAAGDTGLNIGTWLLEQFKKVEWDEIGKAAVSVAAGFILGFVNGLFDPIVWWDIISKYWDEIIMVLIGIVAAPARILAPLLKALSKIPIVGKFAAWLIGKIHDVGRKVLDPFLKVFKDLAGSLWKGFVSGIDLGGGKLFPTIANIIKLAIDKLKDFRETIFLKGLYLMESLGKAIANAGPKQVVQAVKKIISDIDIGLTMFVQRVKEIGGFLVKGLWSGIVKSKDWVVDKVKGFASSIADGFKSFFGINSPSKLMSDYGGFIVQGLANGIESMKGWISGKISSFSDSVASKFKSFFGISSPSKLMAQYGKFIAQGLAEGIEANKGIVVEKATLMAKSIVSALDKVSSSLNLTADIARAKFDLIKTKMGENAEESKILKAQMESLTEQMGIQKNKLSVLHQAYEDMKSTKGENAEETQRLLLELLKEQQAYEELSQSIEKSKQSLEQLNQEKQKNFNVNDEGTIFEKLEGGGWLEVGERQAPVFIDDPEMRPGTPEYREANPDMPWFLGGGKKYHTGGEVTKLGPKEVPIIAEEGEIVVNPDRAKRQSSLAVDGIAPIVINFQFPGTNIFSGSKSEFKRFIQADVMPIVNREIGKTVLGRKKV